MYAERFADGPRFRPASLGAALALNGGVIAALLLAGPELIPTVPREPTTIFDVPVAKPEPEPTIEPRQAEPRPQPSASVATPKPAVETPQPTGNPLTGNPETGEPAGTGTGTGAGPIEQPIDPPIPPLFVAASQDVRFLRDFQPPYPDYERDAGREDIVRLRIRIGVDGRVKQVERLAGRDSFARAAIAHALAKWRFRPATRGGVPEESWKLMTVRFTLNA